MTKTLKRLFLVFLTILAAVLVMADLLNSWNQPQFQSRLELYQTDLLLQASEWQGNQNNPNNEAARKVLTAQKPTQVALENYQKTRQSVEKAIETAQSNLKQPSASSSSATLKGQLTQQESFQDELILRIGLLQAQEGQVDAALKTWQQLQSSSSTEIQLTESVLIDLWSEPPQIPPRAEPILKKNLNGWFRYRGLSRLYTLQQRSDALNQLRAAEQQSAQQAFLKWLSTNALPAIAVILGLGLLIALVGQRLLKGKQALLAGTNNITWTVPWDSEIVWQVLVVGFFFVGQIVIGQILLPLGLGIVQARFGIEPATFDVRGKAALSLVTYLLLAAGGLGVLYGSIKSFLPLPQGWFRFSLQGRWFWWGLGGYLAAYPLVVAVSWVNEQIWQGRGGSNPILPIALQGRDPVAMGLFFVTAAIAAPFFEETFFRGFLLPSLTKYFSTWQAILLSSLLFAVVHLSLSEVIPLMTLGIILGFVYTRTQNLMTSVLLHALWNGGTLLTLFLIGSAAV